MAKMHTIDYVQVTRNKMVEKRFPQGRGVGVRWILGEETENKGVGTEGLGTRIARVGDWTYPSE
jgi:hypothetical protein